MSVKYEIDLSLIQDKTIREISGIDYTVRACGGSVNAGIDQKTGIACMYAMRNLSRYRFSDKGRSMTFRQFNTLCELTSEKFIHIHRLNYMTYRTVQDVYDWLEEKGYCTPNVKRYWRKIENVYERYMKEHGTRIDHESYVTVQDHVRLASDVIQPLMEPLMVSIRDYLIRIRPSMVAAGQKDDITLLTHVQVGFLFCAALRNTFGKFFGEAEHDLGVDLTPDYSYADISPICRNFAWMAEQLGVACIKDKDGDYTLRGVNVDESNRFVSAWDAIVKVVTDDELMDEMAKRAIYMNPESKACYERIIAEEQEKELSSAIGELGTKFNVSNL